MIQIGVYIPQFIQARQIMQQNIAISSERIDAVVEALTPVCEDVIADDPAETYQEDGYYCVSGYLHKRDYFDKDTQTSHVYFFFDVCGTITSVTYCCDIDPDASLEENLSRAEKDFEILNAPIKELQSPIINPEMLSIHTLSDEFKDAFLNGSLYESIRIQADYGSVSVWYHFDTGSEHTRSEIRLRVG